MRWMRARWDGRQPFGVRKREPRSYCPTRPSPGNWAALTLLPKFVGQKSCTQMPPLWRHSTTPFGRHGDSLGGKIDFVLHAIASSNNIRKARSYGDLNYDWFVKTLDVSALSFHKMMHCLEQGDYINAGGSVVCVSFDAAHRNYGTYSDMAEGKALLESITRSYGARLGKLKKARCERHFSIPEQNKGSRRDTRL